MEYEKIKQLMEDMGDSKLTELNIDFPDGTKISMKKEENKIIQTVENLPIPVEDIQRDKEKKKEEIKGNIVKSPMVGTFYSKPSPTSESFVHIGQKVKKGDVLCIIEAMKLMNEIESEWDGEIKEILVREEETVEYGKPLFIIA